MGGWELGVGVGDDQEKQPRRLWPIASGKQGEHRSERATKRVTV